MAGHVPDVPGLTPPTQPDPYNPPPQRMSQPVPPPPLTLQGLLPQHNSSVQGPGPDVNVGVDRNTSVRSVMTLPTYNQAPSHNEQVLGREGEGMDIVVESLETVNEKEHQHEAEMEALYQVRLARRREDEEREERRRLRREARERGDYVALREIQARGSVSSTAHHTL
jgi:hypothetical protein